MQRATEGISVVIPSFGRVRYLHSLLEALKEGVERFPLPSEIIIVDSTPAPNDVSIRALAREFGCLYLRAPNAVSLKRNIGFRHARYAAVLYLDSDCKPSPDVLEQHWKCLNSGKDVGGCLGLVIFEGKDHWFWDVIELTPYTLPFQWPLYEKEVPWGPTANISFWKHVLLEVGGFDETFPPWPGGEDVDLGLRITERGYRILTNPHAKVFHTRQTWLGWRKMAKRLYRWGQADYYLYLKHPNRVFFQFPRNTIVWTGVGVEAIILSLLKRDLSLTLFAPMFITLAILLQAWFQHLRFGVKRKNSTIMKQLASILLSLLDEVGFVLLATKNMDIKALIYKMKYTSGQQIGEWHYGSVRVWSMILSLIITTVIVLLGRFL